MTDADPNDDYTSNRTLVLNTVGAFVSKFGLTFLGLLTVVVLTHQLPKVDYGIYASSIALVYLLAPVLELGTNHLMAQAIATDRDPAAIWRSNIAVHLAAATAGGVALAATQPLVLPDSSRTVVFLLVASELIGPGLTAGAVIAAEAANRAFIGVRVRWVAVAIKSGALAAFALMPDPSLVKWCVLQLGSSAVSFWFTLWAVDRKLGLPVGLRRPSFREIRTGLAFTTNQVSSTALKDLDKVMLGSFGLSSQNADYTAGHRFVALGLLPLQAALSGSYGEFFRRGARNDDDLDQLTRRLSLASVPLMAVIALAMYVAAPAIPWLLGAEYEDSVAVVRVLAVLPALKALQGFVGNALAARGEHGWRLASMLLAVAFNAALNLLLLERYGWHGAAVATLAAEVLLTLLLWGIFLGRPRGQTAESASATG